MAKKKTKEQARQARMAATKQKAEMFFGYYLLLGPDRSLDALYDFATGIGMRRARSTFARWSVDYGWQNKIMELESKAKEERDRTRTAQINDMNDSQAKDARNMRAIARAGMSAYAKIIQMTGTIDLSPQDIATLMREGSKIERLAMGEATERFEAMIWVYNVMNLSILAIFKEINPIKDEIERFNAYTTQVDDLVHTKLIEYVNPPEEH